MKLSELRSAAEVHERNMQDPEYQGEYDRTMLANDVALRVLAYRAEHRMSQAALARKMGMKQPNIARLESGEHEPSLSTLARLSSVLGMDFAIDITAGDLTLGTAPRPQDARGSRFALIPDEAYFDLDAHRSAITAVLAARRDVPGASGVLTELIAAATGPATAGAAGALAGLVAAATGPARGAAKDALIGLVAAAGALSASDVAAALERQPQQQGAPSRFVPASAEGRA